MFPLKDIVGTVGEFAFEYGLFAGHEDLNPSTDPTPGICVTFGHRSLEEFFWSFGFLHAWDDGKSVDDILGLNYEKPIFMVNPLVFAFCLWLLTRDFFGRRMIVYDKLVTYAAQQIDVYMLDTDDIKRMYSAMHINKANSLKLEFIKRVFEKCEHVRHLRVDRVGLLIMPKDLMGLLSHSLLDKLTQLSIADFGSFYSPHETVSSYLTISIKLKYSDDRILETLLSNSNILERSPVVCSHVQGSNDLSTLLDKYMKELSLEHGCESKGPLFTSSEFPFCAQFTHFTTEHYHIHDSAAFMRAVKDGKFPNLRRIELKQCTMNDGE